MTVKKSVEQRPVTSAEAAAAAQQRAELEAVKAATEQMVALTPPAPAQTPVQEPSEPQQPTAPPTQPTSVVGGKKGSWLSVDDEKVLAVVQELDRTGNVELRRGGLAHMQTRHQIGGVWDTHYPKDRQQHGEKVMREAAVRYNIALSDIYRMLKFYRLRPDFNAFCDEFPDVTTWSAVKDLLPVLEGGGNVEDKRRKNKDQALVERLKQDLKLLRDADLAGNVAKNDVLALAEELEKSSKEVVALVITARPVTSPEQPIGVQEPAAT